MAFPTSGFEAAPRTKDGLAFSLTPAVSTTGMSLRVMFTKYTLYPSDFKERTLSRQSSGIVRWSLGIRRHYFFLRNIHSSYDLNHFHLDDVTAFSKSPNTFVAKDLTLALCNKICRIPRENLIENCDYGMLKIPKFNQLILRIKENINEAE